MRYYILILIILMAGSCRKDELTYTVPLKLNVKLSSNNSLDNYLVFTEGTIGIEKIVFEGSRETGSDVNFETQPGITFGPENFTDAPAGTLITNFDIPQGEYYSIRWEVYFEGLITTSDDDINSSSGLIIKGTYTYLNGNQIPFLFKIDAGEYFRVSSVDSSGNSSIVLSKDKTYNAYLQFDPVSTFSTVDRGSIENAEVNDDEGISTLEISSDSNEDLYGILLNRIEKTAQIIIH